MPAAPGPFAGLWLRKKFRTDAIFAGCIAMKIAIYFVAQGLAAIYVGIAMVNKSQGSLSVSLLVAISFLNSGCRAGRENFPFSEIKRPKTRFEAVMSPSPTPWGEGSVRPSECELTMRLVLDTGRDIYAKGSYAFSDPVCLKKRGDLLRMPSGEEIVLNVSASDERLRLREDFSDRFCMEDDRTWLFFRENGSIRCRWNGRWVAGWPFTVELTTLAYSNTSSDPKLVGGDGHPAAVRELISGIDAAVNGKVFNLWSVSEEEAVARASARRYLGFSSDTRLLPGEISVAQAVASGRMVVIPGIHITGSNNKQPMNSEVSLRFSAAANPGDVAPKDLAGLRFSGLASRALWRTVEALSLEPAKVAPLGVVYCALAENSEPPTEIYFSASTPKEGDLAPSEFPKGQPRFVYAFSGSRSKISLLIRLSIDADNKIASLASVDCSTADLRPRIMDAADALNDAKELFNARSPTEIVSGVQRLAEHKSKATETVRIVEAAYKSASAEIVAISGTSRDEGAAAAYDLATKIARPVDEIFPALQSNPAPRPGQFHLDAKLDDRWQSFWLGLWHAVPVQVHEGNEPVKFSVREDSLIPSVLLLGLRRNFQRGFPSLTGAFGVTGTRETLLIDTPACKTKGEGYPGDGACSKNSSFRFIPHATIWLGSLSFGYGYSLDFEGNNHSSARHRVMLGVDLVRLFSNTTLAAIKGGSFEPSN